MPLTRIERKLAPALLEFESTRKIDHQMLRLAVAFGMIVRTTDITLRGSDGAFLDHALTERGNELLKRIAESSEVAPE